MSDLSIEEALKIAAEAVRIHRDSKVSIETAAKAALEIHYEIEAIRREKEEALCK